MGYSQVKVGTSESGYCHAKVGMNGIGYSRSKRSRAKVGTLKQMWAHASKSGCLALTKVGTQV